MMKCFISPVIRGSQVIYAITKFLVGFEVLTAVSMKMTVFWVVAQCSLVEVYQRFRDPCCLHYHRPDDGGSKDL
jgi:hypothetical protein